MKISEAPRATSSNGWMLLNYIGIAILIERCRCTPAQIDPVG